MGRIAFIFCCFLIATQNKAEALSCNCHGSTGPNSTYHYENGTAGGQTDSDEMPRCLTLCDDAVKKGLDRNPTRAVPPAAALQNPASLNSPATQSAPNSFNQTKDLTTNAADLSNSRANDAFLQSENNRELSKIEKGWLTDLSTQMKKLTDFLDARSASTNEQVKSEVQQKLADSYNGDPK